MKKFGLAIEIGGGVASSFTNSFKNVDNSMNAIGTRINKLNKTKLQIKEFSRLSKDATKNKDKLNQLGRSLKKVGIDTNNFKKDTRALRLSLINLKKASKIDVKINGIKDKFSQEKASILGIGASLYGLASIARGANTVLKAQGEIKSLDISTKGIDAITKSGHNMSLQYGQITAPAFIKASYDIKSGISSLSDQGVKDMTRMAAVTGVATKSSTAEMTKLYALGYGIFREDFSNDMDFGKKFSGAIAGAVQAFRTDGSDLAGGISNIGASAKAMGVSLEEELSIIGLSKGAFNSASEAGSGYRAFLDGTGKAQEKLGLNFVDAQGKMLPMVQILDKIKNKYGDLDLAEIDDLKSGFGSSEAVKIITALLPKTKELEKAQIDLKNSMDSGMSKSEKMAKDMQSGYGFEKMSNALSYMGFTLGKVVTPAVDVLATGLGGLASGIAWLDDKVPGLIPIFAGVTFGIVGLVTVLKLGSLATLGLSLAKNTLKKSMLLGIATNNANAVSLNRVSISARLASAKTLAFGLAQKSAAVGSGVLGFALKGISLVLSNTPLGWFVKGLMAIAGVGTYLYNKFEPFQKIIDKIGRGIGSFFGFNTDEKNKEIKEEHQKPKEEKSFFSSFFKEEKKTKTINEIQTIQDDKPINNLKFNGLKKAIAPVVIGTQLAASTLNIPQPKLNEQSLNIPTQKEIQNTSLSNVQTTNNKALNAPITNHYTISVTVQNPSSSIDIADAVKSAIRDIEADSQDRSMEDLH